MRDRLRGLVDSLRDFANRTTYHGLLHIFLSDSRVRRTFWLLLLLAGLFVGLFHTAVTVQKFSADSTTSQIRLKSEKAVFPDITICNFKPVSVGLRIQLDLIRYISSNWLYWMDWFREEKDQRDGESFPDYWERHRKICRRLLRVLWASADTRDISHLDKTMLLQCSYNGLPCTHENFSLVQTNDFWNCYTFHPDPRHLSSGSGGRSELEMVLFTDGFSNQNEFDPSYSKEYWRINRESPDCITRIIAAWDVLNRMLASENEFNRGGVRIFIHESQKYPLHSTEFVDVAAASSVNIQLRPIRSRLLPMQRRRCSEPPLEKARYVSHFAHASQNVVTKEFTKSVADFVIEAKQKFIKQQCGCYSHQYPFQVNNSQLCYYAPPANWKKPSESVLNNIQCHDEWFEKAEQQTSELKKEFQNRRWCDYWRFRPWQQSSRWPPFEVLSQIWNDLMIPPIKNGFEFQARDGRNHHIMNHTVTTFYRNYSRQVSLFLLGQAKRNGCRDYFACQYLPCVTPTKIMDPNKCVDPDSLAQNVAAVRIGLQSPAADLYEEAEEFHWTEALSEIGGTMGLWLGMSVLSALELLELLYVLVDVCIRGRRPAELPEAPVER